MNDVVINVTIYENTPIYSTISGGQEIFCDVYQDEEVTGDLDIRFAPEHLMDAIIETGEQINCTVLFSGNAGGGGTTQTMTQKIDDTHDPLVYVGFAPVGSSEGSSVWQIKRVDITSESTALHPLWANGAQTYINKWDDRLTLPYA